jgi:putative flippase GtrA
MSNTTASSYISSKQSLVQAFKFLLFSCSAGIVQVTVFTLLNTVFHPSYWYAYLPALICSVLYNFTVNREFTFKSTANVPVAMLKILMYYCVFTPASTWWGEVLVDRCGWNEYIVLFGTMVINLISEFLVYRCIIYRGNMNTNKRAQREVNGLFDRL